MKSHSPQAQQRRRLELAAAIRAALRPLLDADAHSDHLLWWDQERMELWASNAFFLGDAADVAFANTILRHARDRLSAASSIGPDPFVASALATLLALHGQRLQTDVRRHCLARLEQLAPLGMTADFQFHGYNDNMPVMWTWALTWAGQTFGRHQFLDIARANLQQLRDLFRRRGAPSEYGAGYATHRLTGLAHIAEHASEGRLRTLARQLEARVWAELAGHWNPALACFGGASMRGGAPLPIESGFLMTHVFGTAVKRPWTARSAYFDTADAVREFGLDPDRYRFAYPFAYAAEFSSATYHVTDSVAVLFRRKPNRFRFTASAECGYVNPGIFCKQIPVHGTGGILIGTRPTNEVVVIPNAPEHGAQAHGLTTFHGRHFVLGSSTTNMFGTSHALRCTWRRVARPRSRTDLGELFIRYNINGKVPGGRLKNTYFLGPEHSAERENYCGLYHDQGQHFCLQHDATVLCLMTPLYVEHWDIRELRADIFLYEPHGPIGTIEQRQGWITLDERAVYVGIHPLIGRQLDNPPTVQIRTIHEWRVISLYNYRGPSRAFGPHDLPKLGNGFVLEVRDAEECRGFRAFQKELIDGRVLDQLYGGRRRVHYGRPGLRMSTHYCPYTHTVMYATVNGIEKTHPPLAFSGGRESGLPFLNGRPSPGFADWDWITTQMSRPVETYNPQE